MAADTTISAAMAVSLNMAAIYREISGQSSFNKNQNMPTA